MDCIGGGAHRPRSSARSGPVAERSRVPSTSSDTVEFERGRALLEAGDEEGARALVRVAPHASAVPLRVDAARCLARRFGLVGRGADAVAVLRPVLDALPGAERELQKRRG